MALSKLCQQGRHDFDQDGTCRRKGCRATTTLTMFPMTTAEEEQAYGFSVDRAAQGFRPGDPQQGLFGNPVLSHEEVQAFAEGVKSRHGLRALWLFPVPGGLRLDMIAVHRGEQGKGKGTAAMRDVLAFADAHRARVYLTTGSADPSFGTTSRARLRRWYKSLGFVMNTGRRRDFTVMADMYRDPQRSNPDDRMRDLERRARQGDPDARHELVRVQERLGLDESVERLNQTVSAFLIAAGVIDVHESLDRIALRAKHAADRAQHTSSGFDLDYFVTDPWGHRRRPSDQTAVYVAIVAWQHVVVIGVKRAPIASSSSITNAWPALDPLEQPGAFAWPHETSPEDRWIAPGVDSMPDHRVRAYASIVRAWSDMRGGRRGNPGRARRRSELTYQEGPRSPGPLGQREGHPTVSFASPADLRLSPDLMVSDLGTWPVGVHARGQLPPGVRFYQVVDSHMGYQDAEVELVRAGFGEARSWHYEALGQPQYFLDGEGRNVQRWIRLLGRKRRPDGSVEWIVWRGQDLEPPDAATVRQDLQRHVKATPAAKPGTKHKMRCRVCGARRKSPACPSCGNFVCKACSTPSCGFCRSLRGNPTPRRRKNPTGRHRGRRTDNERISLDEVEELFSPREIGNAAGRYELFHGVDPTGARVVQVDDGKPGVERKLVVALGEVPETHYRVPWESQKFTGDDWKAWKKRWKKGKPPKVAPVHWVHHHMDEAMPLEVLDPETGLTLKLFTTPHTQVTDYWRDGECERCGRLPGKCKCQPK